MMLELFYDKSLSIAFSQFNMDLCFGFFFALDLYYVLLYSNRLSKKQYYWKERDVVPDILYQFVKK